MTIKMSVVILMPARAIATKQKSRLEIRLPLVLPAMTQENHAVLPTLSAALQRCEDLQKALKCAEQEASAAKRDNQPAT